MAVNFKELLSRPVESAERPPVKPAGTYHGVIKEYKFDESRDKKTPFVRFVFSSLTPGADIHPSQLVNPKTGDQIDLSKWAPYKDFYLTEDALYRLREFLQSLGIPIAGRQFDETIPESKGMPVILSAVLNQSQKDNSEMYTNIDKAIGTHEID